MTQYLNVRLNTSKFLEENIGRTLFDKNCHIIFLDLSPRVMKRKPKISKWDLIKLKRFFIMKETISKEKCSLQNGRKQ